MTGKKWSELLELIQEVSAVFSITINAFLIFLILTKSPKHLGAYKYLMIFISVFEIAYSILDVVLVPQHYSHGSTFLVIVGLHNKLFGPDVLTILNSCYWGFFGASMAVFAVHFVYRWLAITEHRLLETFNDWRICLWLGLPLGYGLTWVFTGYFLCAPNEHTTKFIRDNIKESFELELGEYIYLGPFLYERLENGEVLVHTMPFIGQIMRYPLSHHSSETKLVEMIFDGVVGAVEHYLQFASAHIGHFLHGCKQLPVYLGRVSVMISSIIFVLVFGVLCYNRISHLIDTSSTSAKYRGLQKQLFYALVVQTLIPFILMHIPAAIMFAFVFLDIDLGIYSALVSMTIAIYPAVDPIPTLVIVKSYRTAVFALLGFWVQRRAVAPEIIDVETRF